MESSITLRKANEKVARSILEIYTPYVENTVVTFEETAPLEQEMRQRILDITKKYPYLLAFDGTQLVGYAYTSAFKERICYRFSVETSIYIK